MVTVGFSILINEQGIATIDKDSLFPQNEGKIIKLTLKDIFIFSATLCASDSVAALTMINEHQYPKIYSILFGEGLINDAVSLILYTSVGKIFKTTDSGDEQLNFDLQKFGLLIYNFFYINITSILVGLVVGVLNAVLLKKLVYLSHKPLFEIVIIIFFGLTSYLICEKLKISGIIGIFINYYNNHLYFIIFIIIALLMCSIIMNHYSFYNLSYKSQIATGVTLKSISHIAENFLFFYLGMSLTSDYVKLFKFKMVYSFSFIGLMLSVIVFARLFSILFLVILWNLIRKTRGKPKAKINIFEQLTVSFGGMIRGAIAYALILSQKVDHENQDSNIRLIQNTVLSIVLLSTVVLGGTMGFLLEFLLNLSQKYYPEIIDLDKELLPKKKNETHAKWRQLDDNFIKPFLIRDYDIRKLSINKAKKKKKQTLLLKSEKVNSIQVGQEGEYDQKNLFSLSSQQNSVKKNQDDNHIQLENISINHQDEEEQQNEPQVNNDDQIINRQQ